jgi:uncharacterized protein (TIGR02284 family)
LITYIKYWMQESGGYVVAAANVNNRALKWLFKTYARQRAEFKGELAKQFRRSGIGFHSLIEVLSMIHRGRMDIFAALTIGDQNQERVVLNEVFVGERTDLKEYEQALQKPLPADIKGLLERQYISVKTVVEQVRLLHGVNGRQTVVRLFDTDVDVSHAVTSLQQANFSPEAAEKIQIESQMEPYNGGGQSTLFDTILSGAVGGAMWGAVSGTLAGIGVLHIPGIGLEHAPLPLQDFVWV